VAREIVHPQATTQRAMGGGGFRGRRNPIVYGAALVGFHRTERQPAQTLDIGELRKCFASQWKLPTLTVVIQRRLIGINQKQIERNSVAPVRARPIGGEPIYVIGDLIDAGLHPVRSFIRSLYIHYVCKILRVAIVSSAALEFFAMKKPVEKSQREENSEATRQALLDAARELFTRVG
jgi:hypothetical protein